MQIFIVLVLLLSSENEPTTFQIIRDFDTLGNCGKYMKTVELDDEKIRERLGCMQILRADKMGLEVTFKEESLHVKNSNFTDSFKLRN